MKGYLFTICAVMFGLISYTYANLEYKGYPRAQGCYGECYEEYIRTHGTLSQQLAEQAELASQDPFSSIRGLWAGCAACHGTEGQGAGAFPKLAGLSDSYVTETLQAYKNRETKGPMSSTMWAQASMLSDNDIQTLAEFIEVELGE